MFIETLKIEISCINNALVSLLNMNESISIGFRYTAMLAILKNNKKRLLAWQCKKHKLCFKTLWSVEKAKAESKKIAMSNGAWRSNNNKSRLCSITFITDSFPSINRKRNHQSVSKFTPLKKQKINVSPKPIVISRKRRF